MTVSEIITTLSLIMMIFGLGMCTIITAMTSYMYWGFPIPHSRYVPKSLWKFRKERPGTNGRWKLEYGLVLFLFAVTLRNMIILSMILRHDDFLIRPYTAVIYVFEGLCSVLLFYQMRYERVHRKEIIDHE